MQPDLSTTYLGLELRSPLVASASPMTGDLDALERLEEAGAGAVVLPSLFEEQIEHDEGQLVLLQEYGADSFGEALDFFPKLDLYNSGTEECLRRIELARERLSIPVIASLNGYSKGGWLHYAALMEAAGASALELNVYWVPSDPNENGADVERRYIELVTAVRESVRIPVSVKVAPVFSAPAHMALRLEQAGAAGLVLFNRLLRPDIDLEQLALVPKLELSERHEARLPLLWIGILREHTKMSLAASSGVHSHLEIVKLLLVGADVVMSTSALLRRGPSYLRVLHAELASWLKEHDYESVRQMRGSMSRANCPDPSAYERANYMRTLVEFVGEAP